MGQKGGDGSRIPDQQVIRKEETLAEVGVSGALDGKTVARFRWALGTSPGPLALADPRTGGKHQSHRRGNEAAGWAEVGSYFPKALCVKSKRSRRSGFPRVGAAGWRRDSCSNPLCGLKKPVGWVLGKGPVHPAGTQGDGGLERGQRLSLILTVCVGSCIDISQPDDKKKMAHGGKRRTGRRCGARGRTK